MPKRLFFAMLGTETNTFSPIPTGLNVFAATTLRRTGKTDEPTVHRGQRVYGPLFARADARDWQILPGLQAFATPSGVTPKAVYEELRDELVNDLEHARPVDAVLLFLHGAMVADGYDDCEGDLLARVRARVGEHVPIGAELDLHCHLTPAMVRHADVLVGYKEYPHVDTYERLLDLFEIVADTAEGRVRPTMATADCRMIGMYHTTREPMRGYVERLAALEREPRVLNAWLAHGFPYGDVPDIGTRAVVVTDDDPALAARHADALAREFFSLREQVQSRPSSIAAAIDAALAGGRFPVTIADTGDNTGGGAPGDSTFVLSELMARRLGGTAIGPLYDPGAVAICEDGGVGARLSLRVGGKVCPASGPPVDVRCTVLALAERVIQTLNGGPSNLGPAAAIRIHLDDAGGDGIDVVLSGRRVQAGSPELFTALGIEPARKRLLFVKSTQHFYAGFAPISAAVLYAGDRGALEGDFTAIPYRRVDTSRFWPFNEQPP